MTVGKRALSLVLWLAFALMLGKHALGLVHATHVPIAGNDFPAFYCAGLAVREHADPYRVEPLRTCEHVIVNGNDQPEAFVTPAPLPGYALAVFAALSFLPYKLAAWLWFGVLTAAIIALAILLARVSNDRLPSGVAAIALLFSAALATVIYGQLPVLATLGIAITGLGLRYSTPNIPTIVCGMLLAMIEPHIGLASAVAIFVCVPALRIALTILALLLTMVSIGAIGVHGNIEYVLQVLPAHARAELGAVDQFSLSHLATFLGLSARAASMLGTFSYLTMFVAGIWFAKPLARKINSSEAIAYLPAAAVLLGGTFLHEIQLIAALPLAFLVFGSVLQAMPRKSAFAPLLITSTLVIAVVALTPFTLYQERHPIANCILTPCPTDTPLDMTTALAGDADASQNWALFLASDPAYARRNSGAELAKVPFWAALFFFLSTIAWSVTRKAGVVSTGIPIRHWREGPEIRIL